jgi:hypothetical protein
MKDYWAYRVLFFGCVALSIGLVVLTVTGRQRSAARAHGPAGGGSALAAVSRPRQGVPDLSLLGSFEGTAALTSRVRITTVIPFRREIHLHNFGDAAQDLGDWELSSPGNGADDRYVLPIGIVLLPGESLVVVVDEGVDGAGLLHWRAPVDEPPILALAGDTVVLRDHEGDERSRFTYVRR